MNQALWGSRRQLNQSHGCVCKFGSPVRPDSVGDRYKEGNWIEGAFSGLSGRCSRLGVCVAMLVLCLATVFYRFTRPPSAIVCILVLYVYWVRSRHADLCE